MRASWHLRALPEYDAVFTTRSANLECFRNIGVPMCITCRSAMTTSFSGTGRAAGSTGLDVLFVGGADDDRIGSSRNS